MRTWHKIMTEVKVLSGAKRNRTDLLRYLLRRPTLLAAMMGYETALLLSSRADDRLKLLAQLKTSALIGCPF
jgi:alkylhydroperoxidase family enzyme